MVKIVRTYILEITINQKQRFLEIISTFTHIWSNGLPTFDEFLLLGQAEHQQVRHQEDDSPGHAGHCPPLHKCLTAKICPPSKTFNFLQQKSSQHCKC